MFAFDKLCRKPRQAPGEPLAAPLSREQKLIIYIFFYLNRALSQSLSHRIYTLVYHAHSRLISFTISVSDLEDLEQYGYMIIRTDEAHDNAFLPRVRNDAKIS